MRALQPQNADKLRLVAGDALTVTKLHGPKPTALVANLPYNISVPVVLSFLEHFPSIQRVLVMVQLEVAERLAAKPGSKTYGVPSLGRLVRRGRARGTDRAQRLLAGAERRLRPRLPGETGPTADHRKP